MEENEKLELGLVQLRVLPSSLSFSPPPLDSSLPSATAAFCSSPPLHPVSLARSTQHSCSSAVITKEESSLVACQEDGWKKEREDDDDDGHDDEEE